MKTKLYFFLILISYLTFSQEKINLPNLNYAVNYGQIEQTISITINRENDILIENKKIEFNNFENELYHSLINKFKNKPYLLQYLAVEFIIDEKVEFSNINILIEKLKQNGLFKLFLSCKIQNKEDMSNNKIGFLLKLNSFYNPYNYKIIDKVQYSIENNEIVENVKYLRSNDSITHLEGINTEKLLKNELENPSINILLDNEKIIVKNKTYNLKTIIDLIKNEYNKNSKTVFVISPDIKCEYKYILSVISDIIFIINDKREKIALKKFNLKYINLNNEQQTEIKNEYPIAYIIGK